MSACALGCSYLIQFPYNQWSWARWGTIPILFTLYMDDLLVELSELGVDYYWEGLFAGAFCYADDLVLLAPSPAVLRIMLRCCESFATSHLLVFNASKAQLIRFSPHSSTTCSAIIYFCNQRLTFSDSVCHLGHPQV